MRAVISHLSSLCGRLRACGLEVTMVGEIGFEPTTLWSQTRCATRLRYSPTTCDGLWLSCTATSGQAEIRISLQLSFDRLNFAVNAEKAYALFCHRILLQSFQQHLHSIPAHQAQPRQRAGCGLNAVLCAPLCALCAHLRQ